MSIPGQNILKMALTLIHKQIVTYYKFESRTPNSIGQDVTTYFPAVTIHGSFQPVPRKLYELYGLDFQKDYSTFYCSIDFIDVTRDVSGDQIVYGNRRYQVESDNDWFRQDGWKGVLCVDLGPDDV